MDKSKKVDIMFKNIVSAVWEFEFNEFKMEPIFLEVTFLRSLKTREKYISLAQFVYFLREVCLFFNFQKLKSNTLPSKNIQTEQN